jgi:hypothetical protein
VVTCFDGESLGENIRDQISLSKCQSVRWGGVVCGRRCVWIPEWSFRIQVSEQQLCVASPPLEDRQGKEDIHKVFRVMKEIREGISLDDEDIVIDPLLALIGLRH